MDSFFDSTLFRRLAAFVLAGGSFAAVFIFIAFPVVPADPPGSEDGDREMRDQGSESPPPKPEKPSVKEEAALVSGDVLAEKNTARMVHPGQACSDDEDRESSAEGTKLDTEKKNGPEEVDSGEVPSRRNLSGAYTLTACGRIVDIETAENITNRRITITAFDASGARDPISGEVDPAAGTYRLDGLGFGLYLVLASVEGYLSYCGTLMMPHEARRDLWFEGAGMVRLRVTDSFARRLRNVRVLDLSVCDPCMPRTLSCREEDGYLLVFGLRQGVKKLAVEKIGLGSVSMDLRIERDRVLCYWAVIGSGTP